MLQCEYAGSDVDVDKVVSGIGNGLLRGHDVPAGPGAYRSSPGT